MLSCTVSAHLKRETKVKIHAVTVFNGGVCWRFKADYSVVANTDKILSQKEGGHVFTRYMMIGIDSDTCATDITVAISV